LLFNNLRVFVKSLTQALKETQVDQDVDQRVLIGDGLTVAQMRALNAERDGLRVDPLDRGALAIDLLVEFTVAVKRVAQTRAVVGIRAVQPPRFQLG